MVLNATFNNISVISWRLHYIECVGVITLSEYLYKMKIIYTFVHYRRNKNPEILI